MNITVSITPELNNLVKAKVQSGYYTSVSEVIREALRMLERADQHGEDETAYFKRVWQQGKDSGTAGPLNMNDIRLEWQRRLALLN